MSVDNPTGINEATATRRRWLAFIVMILCGYVAGYNVGKVSAALTHIRADLDLSLFLAGTIASSYSAAAMLSAIIIGMFVSRAGPVLSVYIGLCLIGVAGAFGATANSYLQLLTGRIAEGFGYILLAISMPILIAKVVDARSRPLAMGVWGSFIPGGVALSMVAALIVQNNGAEEWRPLWWLTALLAVLCLVLTTLFVVPVLRSVAHRQASTKTMKSEGALYTSVFQRDPVLLAISFLLYSMFFVTLVTYLPTVLVETSAVGLDTATRLSVFVVLFNILGNLLGGWLIGKGVGLKRLLITALIGASLFSSVVFLEGVNVPVRVACGLLACLCGGMLPASVFASVASFVSTKQSGLLLGVIFQALGTGQVAGPVLMAALVEQMNSWRWGAVYYVCLAVVSAVVLSRFQAQKPQA